LALLNSGCHENEKRVFQRNGYGRWQATRRNPVERKSIA